MFYLFVLIEMRNTIRKDILTAAVSKISDASSSHCYAHASPSAFTLLCFGFC